MSRQGAFATLTVQSHAVPRSGPFPTLGYASFSGKQFAPGAGGGGVGGENGLCNGPIPRMLRVSLHETSPRSAQRFRLRPVHGSLLTLHVVGLDVIVVPASEALRQKLASFGLGNGES